MNDPVHEFGSVLSVDAEAIGQPGQRRFRLLVLSSYGAAWVWMEKEQLSGIGTWLTETVEKLDVDRPTAEPDAEPLPFPAEVDVDISAGQLALGYVEDRDVFAIQVYDLQAAAGEQQARPLFRCFLGRGQSRVLGRKIAKVVAGGRPPCPLCGEPMDPSGHVCPRSNGHRDVRLTQ
ncbi:MAG TPA: DUF3090 family protein [Dehalococcoidia bacterium]|jgi:uncharacterized repeat protein (TIGR03847 family)